MKIAIIDLLGLTYDGHTLSERGLGGSESAVILISKELQKIGFDVTVFNSCIDSQANPGTYNGVTYIDHSQADPDQRFDVVISSRSVYPFFSDNQYGAMCAAADYKVLWLHDTFCEGDEHIENMLNTGAIDQLFTLSDFHTNYILNCEHGVKRNFEVLKNKIFQTRNGAVKWDVHEEVEREKNHFVYNASVTKGLKPLLNHIWPKVKQKIPGAKLTVIGGYYRFREGAEPDAQEKDLKEFEKNIPDEMDVSFTGVISQREIARILKSSGFMIYPTDFPETFGISTLESLLYNTPVITCNFGALESTALDLACYKINYASVPNGLFPHIDENAQSDLFVETVINAYNDDYLYGQKQNYCGVLDEIYGWDTIALQWKQQIYFKMEQYLPRNDFYRVQDINDQVNRIFNKTFQNEVERNSHRKDANTEKRIVIISPFRNAKNFIRAHCESIDQQNYNNYHHIVINDFSDDGSETEIPHNDNRTVIHNSIRKGCFANQMYAVLNFVDEHDIVMFLDGDDFLVSNNTIFDYYNTLYWKGYEFTYGSCWSLADGIPLIAQEYPEDVRKNKTYRDHLFNWKIPYTHIRTCLGKVFKHLDWEKYKDAEGNYGMAGMDNPLFYELIENTPYQNIKAVKEIFCYYNDLNPLNDYKVNSEEQTVNSNKSYEEIYRPKKEKVVAEDATTKKILIAIPTNAGIEPETFRSIYNMKVPDGYETHFEYFYGYQIDQIRNLIADWAKHYDYLFSVDSDIVVPEDALEKMISHDLDAVSGVYIQRLHDRQTVELYYKTNMGHMNYTGDDLPRNKLIEVSGFGFGCALIKREVFLAIDYPHFEYRSALDHKHTLSEDIDFCMKAEEKGFKLYADTSIICDHIGKHTFKLPEVPSPEVEPDPGKFIVNITLGEDNFAEVYDKIYPNSRLVNFNARELINDGETLDVKITGGDGIFPDIIRVCCEGMDLLSLMGSRFCIEQAEGVIFRGPKSDDVDKSKVFQFLIDMGLNLEKVILESEIDADYYFSKN